METRHLKYFLAVAKTLNFRKAAEELFIAQPPLSRQIKELEQYLGVQLFIRDNRNVSLTDAGHYLNEKGAEILNQIKLVETTLPQIQEGYSGSLKIGYISSIFHNQLPEILNALHRQFPQIKTKLHEMISVEQKIALENGRLDIGIVRMPFYSKDLITRTLFKEPLALIFPKNKSIQHIAEAKGEGFILFNKENAQSYFEKIIQLCSIHGFSPEIVHEANSMHTIVNMVENGLGISIVPSSIVHQYKRANINSIIIKGSSTEVAITYHRANQKPIILDFIKLSKRTFKISTDKPTR